MFSWKLSLGGIQLTFCVLKTPLIVPRLVFTKLGEGWHGTTWYYAGNARNLIKMWMDLAKGLPCVLGVIFLKTALHWHCGEGWSWKAMTAACARDVRSFQRRLRRHPDYLSVIFHNCRNPSFETCETVRILAMVLVPASQRDSPSLKCVENTM